MEGIMKSFTLISMFILLSSFMSFANDPTDIVLQYKYKSNGVNQEGKLKGDGYYLVETNLESGNYGTVIFVPYDKKNRTFSVIVSALKFKHDATRSKVTAYDSGTIFYGQLKGINIKGRYGGFTDFNLALKYVATVMNGAICNYVNEDNWFASKKAGLKLDLKRTKHLIEEGDVTMAGALAHMRRWMVDQGYTETI